MEVRLGRVGDVVNPVVRLHNFLRRRRAAVPQAAWNMTLPDGVVFGADDRLEGDYYEKLPPRGRPSKAGTVSPRRESIRKYLEQMSIGRPKFNLDRNRKRVI